MDGGVEAEVWADFLAKNGSSYQLPATVITSLRVVFRPTK